MKHKNYELWMSVLIDGFVYNLFEVYLNQKRRKKNQNVINF